MKVKSFRSLRFYETIKICDKAVEEIKTPLFTVQVKQGVFSEEGLT